MIQNDVPNQVRNRVLYMVVWLDDGTDTYIQYVWKVIRAEIQNFQAVWKFFCFLKRLSKVRFNHVAVAYMTTPSSEAVAANVERYGRHVHRWQRCLLPVSFKCGPNLSKAWTAKNLIENQPKIWKHKLRTFRCHRTSCSHTNNFTVYSQTQTEINLKSENRFHSTPNEYSEQ